MKAIAYNSTAVNPPRATTILGVRFLAGDAASVVGAGLRGGLVVAPSAPVLAALDRNEALREALTHADLAVMDSGLMVLVWGIATGERLQRVSGLKYLQLLLGGQGMKGRGAIAWVMPTLKARDRNLAWLRGRGFPTTADDCYVAPRYSPGASGDPALLEFVMRRRPEHLVIALGGETQEPLGLFLRRSLDYTPGIHCLGAAIGFLSGDQANIPAWADHMFLGWLVRCLYDPRRFVPRYWRAARLVGLIVRYRSRLPPLAGGAA
jgi:UDP-N-acetyl-D-mannosaminuronic acid transferase (WecB/TagA/CpsF family)